MDENDDGNLNFGNDDIVSHPCACSNHSWDIVSTGERIKQQIKQQRRHQAFKIVASMEEAKALDMSIEHDKAIGGDSGKKQERHDGHRGKGIVSGELGMQEGGVSERSIEQIQNIPCAHATQLTPARGGGA